MPPIYGNMQRANSMMGGRCVYVCAAICMFVWPKLCFQRKSGLCGLLPCGENIEEMHLFIIKEPICQHDLIKKTFTHFGSSVGVCGGVYCVLAWTRAFVHLVFVQREVFHQGN